MCRALLHNWKDENGKEVYMGRSNTGVVTCNFPRIAMEAQGDKDLFFKILEERLHLCMDVGEWRFNRLISMKAKEAAFSFVGGAFGLKFDPEESVAKAYTNGRGSISVGFIGLHEVCLAMIGDEPHYNEDAKQFQKDVLMFTNEIVDKRKEESGLAFSIYSSPIGIAY